MRSRARHLRASGAADRDAGPAWSGTAEGEVEQRLEATVPALVAVVEIDGDDGLATTVLARERGRLVPQPGAVVSEGDAAAGAPAQQAEAVAVVDPTSGRNHRLHLAQQVRAQD